MDDRERLNKLRRLKELRLKAQAPTPAQAQQPQPETTPIDAFGYGAAQYTSFGLDPYVRGVGRMIATGEPYSEAVSDIRGDLKTKKKEQPTAYGAGEVAGNIVTAMITGPQKAAATTLGRIGQQAAAGAAQEGVTQFFQEEGDLYDKFKRGIQGAGMAAITAGGVTGALEGGRKVASSVYKAAVAPKTQQKLIEQLTQEGAPLTAGQVMGGATQAAEGYSSQMATGVGLREMGERQGQYIQANAAGLFEGKIPSTPDEAGNALVGGLKKSAELFNKRKQRLYDKALQNIPDETPFVAEKSRQIVNEIIAEGGDNPALRKLISAPEFSIIDDALSGNVTLGQAKKTIKSRLWDFATKYEKEQPSISRKFKDIYFAIDEDILGTVEKLDPTSGAKLKAADAYMSERMAQNEQLRKIFDPRKGANETAAKAYYAAVGMASDGRSADPKTLLILKKTLPKEEFEKFRSFLFSNLGKETAGQAGFEAGIAPRKFLTDYNKLSKEAKGILLSPPQKTALDKLAQYAEVISPVILNKSGTAASGAEVVGTLGGVSITPWALSVPILNFIYGKSYDTKAGKALVRAINKLPREVLTSPPSPAVRNTIRGMILSVGGSEKDAEEIDQVLQQEEANAMQR